MSRTVTYPKGGIPVRSIPRTTEAIRGEAPDRYGDKLLKYIPVEVIAFFPAAYHFAIPEPTWVKWAVLLSGAIGTLLYLLIRTDRSRPPRWYFYPLSVLAFLAWSFGTSSVGTDLFHLRQAIGQITLAVGVFLIPLIDEAFTMVTTRA